MIAKRMLLAAAMAAAMVSGCEDKGGGKGTGTSAAPTATAAEGKAPGAKTFDCGAREQKPCPMQGWMKRVMAPASSSGDAEGLAKALTYVAEHTPPGYSDWTAIASDGVAKAKAGDVDGARASCKRCHDAHKDRYKETMRDRPF